MDHYKEYDRLLEIIGRENIEILYYQSKSDSVFDYSNIKIEYLSTGKCYFGETYNTQIENAVHALQQVFNDLE
mgnify:CR=1 FL=1